MFLLRAALLSLAFTAACRHEAPSVAAPRSYFIDCTAGDDAASGADPAHAWRTLRRAGAQPLVPGSQILIRRGTTCEAGVPLPGSGSAAAPIRLSAYGQGPLPVLDGGGAPYVLKLHNQHGWELSLLDLKGGTLGGLAVSCDDKQVHAHFRLTNLVVRGVRGTALSKRKGLVAFAPVSTGCTFASIEIDGISAYDSTQWAGIVVDGGYPPARLEEVVSRFDRWRFRTWPPVAKRARGVAIRNSVVHDVAGDGIVIFRAEDAVIESNVSWNVGLQERGLLPGQSPNGMWTLLCRNCAIRDNEAFLTDTPIVDGGGFDIDWGCDNNVMEYNYAHDNMGYCFSIFGSRAMVTSGSVARYNLCVNNGRGPRMAKRQGDIFLSTWDNGRFDGLEVYRNTIIWNPSVDAAMFRISDAHEVKPVGFTGSQPRHISDNLAILRSSSIGAIDPGLTVRGNRFWLQGQPDRPRLDPLLRPLPDDAPRGAYRGGTGAPFLDAFRAPIRSGEEPFAGALLPSSATLEAVPAGRKTLLVRLNPGREGARRLVVLARSAAQQFVPVGLQMEFRVSGHAPRNLPHDWHFADLPHRFEAGAAEGAEMEIVDDRGAVLMAWPRHPTAAALNLASRWFVGEPGFSPSIAFAFEGNSFKKQQNEAGAAVLVRPAAAGALY